LNKADNKDFTFQTIFDITGELLSFDAVSMSLPVIVQYGSNCILGIMKVWGFQPKYITQKPASHFLFNSFAVLVMHSQAQIYLQINLKPFQQVVSINQEWKGIQA